jgi:hypothetical protein
MSLRRSALVLCRRADIGASCNCSICRRHGALWAYGFEGEAFTVSGETSTYVWNRRSLAFHFCGHVLLSELSRKPPTIRNGRGRSMRRCNPNRRGWPACPPQS